MSINHEKVAGNNAKLYNSRLSQGCIRLLYIDPATQSCSFETHKLSDASSYVCISYTWGTPEGKRDEAASLQRSLMSTTSLLLGGNHHGVSRNVLDVISRVMDHGDVERIWVDSICINQFDLVERSAQVSMMGNIYEAADVVAVWLGRDERHEFSQVEEICRAIQAALHQTPNGVTEKISNLFERDTRDRLALSFITDSSWYTFTQFWNRAWFHRAWVMQEAALARGRPRFFWGQNELENDMLYDASRFLLQAEICLSVDTDMPTLQNSASTRTSMRPYKWFTISRKLGETLEKVRGFQMAMYQPLEEKIDGNFWRKCETLGGPEIIGGRVRTDCMRLWTHLLENFRALDATDDRDYVYATLGIIKATAAHQSLDVLEIIVDYTQPVAAVYADAAEKIIRGGNCVNLLCLAQDPRARNRQYLPSWVPDFIAGTSLPIRMTEITRWQLMSKMYKLAREAINQSHLHFDVCNDLRTLRVKAIMLDEIVAIGESHEELTNHGLWEQTARILLSRQSFSDFPNENRLESLWRTMVASTSFDGDAIAPAEVAGYFKTFVITSLVTKLMHDPNHLNKMPSWKELTAIEQRLAAQRGEENVSLLGLQELLDISAEVDRRWTAIEAGDPVPQTNPVASRAAMFARATEPMFYRRIILTKKGYLGIGPHSTCPGDLVWVMPGSPLPTVLRKKSAGSADAENSTADQFTLIGEA
ncbi:heterokaryon incompatibility protein-domain-containing protein [Xylaria sp. FL0043]|nr:heterokaryon incompatibility protein-domain-containing protein [Xylaria sp. FL0043]